MGLTRLGEARIVGTLGEGLGQLLQRLLLLAVAVERHAEMVIELRPRGALRPRPLQERHRHRIVALAVLQPAQRVEEVGVLAGAEPVGQRQGALELLLVLIFVVGDQGRHVVGGDLVLGVLLQHPLEAAHRVVHLAGNDIGRALIEQEPDRVRHVLVAGLVDLGRTRRVAGADQQRPELAIGGEPFRLQLDRLAIGGDRLLRLLGAPEQLGGELVGHGVGGLGLHPLPQIGDRVVELVLGDVAVDHAQDRVGGVGPQRLGLEEPFAALVELPLRQG